MAAMNKSSTLQPVGKVSNAAKEVSSTKVKSIGQEILVQNISSASGSSALVFTSNNQQSTHVYTTPLTSQTLSSTPQIGNYIALQDLTNII